MAVKHIDRRDEIIKESARKIQSLTKEVNDLKSQISVLTKKIEKNTENANDSDECICVAMEYGGLNITDWDYSINKISKNVILNKYIGNAAEVIVSDEYEINGEKYKTILNPSTIFAINTFIRTVKFDGKFSNMKSLDGMFVGCILLQSIDFGDEFDTSDTTRLSFTFRCCTSLKSIYFGKKFDTSNVTNMGYLFYGCARLTNIDLSNFNTSKVTTMMNMFTDCKSLISLNLSSFNTCKLINMSNMFNGCESLIILDLRSFSTSKVRYIDHLFFGCRSLDQININRRKWNLNHLDIKDINSVFDSYHNKESIFHNV